MRGPGRWWAAIALAAATAGTPGAAAALGRVEAGVVAGPEGYVENSFALSLDLGRHADVAARTFAARSDDAATAWEYRMAAELRVPGRLRVAGGYGFGPEADDRETRTVWGEAAVTFGPWDDLGAFDTELTLAVERTVLAFSPLDRRGELEQRAVGVEAAQRLFGAWVLSAAWWDYRYDRDVEAAVRLLASAGRLRRRPSLLRTASHLVGLPDRIYAPSLDVEVDPRLLCGVHGSRIDAEVDLADEAAYDLEYGAEITVFVEDAVDLGLGVSFYEAGGARSAFGAASVGVTF